MRGFHDLDVPARHRVAVAGDDQSRELRLHPRPAVLDRARHRRRGLAGTDDDDAATCHAGGLGEEFGHAARGRRDSEGGVEEFVEEFAGLHMRIDGLIS